MFTKDNLVVSFREYRDNRITVCKIIEHLLRTAPEIFIGIARLKPGEKRNKFEAEEVSLGRALKCAGFSKEYRASFVGDWKQDYLSRHPAAVTETPDDIEVINGVPMRKLAPRERTKEGDAVYYKNTLQYKISYKVTTRKLDEEWPDNAPHSVYRPID
jgi:hypothetical protein